MPAKARYKFRPITLFKFDLVVTWFLTNGTVHTIGERSSIGDARFRTHGRDDRCDARKISNEFLDLVMRG